MEATLLEFCMQGNLASIKNTLHRATPVEITNVLAKLYKTPPAAHGDAVIKLLLDACTSSHHAVATTATPTTTATTAGTAEESVHFDSIEDAVEALRRGEFIVVVDDEGRENEGDLIMVGDRATPEAVTFMVRYTSGVICASLPGEVCDRLRLPPMVQHNTESHQTAFTVSTDYRVGTTTGISAADRCATLRALSSAAANPDDFSRPGHIFPLRARPGGVLERAGHTEASVDLARLAGCAVPCGVICEIVNEDGSMARRDQLALFARRFNLRFITIEQLIQYRKKHNK